MLLLSIYLSKEIAFHIISIPNLVHSVVQLLGILHKVELNGSLERRDGYN